MENFINQRAWSIRRDVAENAGVELMEINWSPCYEVAREEYLLNEKLRDSGNDDTIDFFIGLVMGFCTLLTIIAFF